MEKQKPTLTRALLLAIAGFLLLQLAPAESLGMRTVLATAYTHTETDHAAYGRKTAAGNRLRFGEVTSAAADWSIFPVGTRFRISGGDTIYEVDDYGSGMVGKQKVDLYRPNPGMMRAWGKRKVKLEVIKWGSFERSLEILKPRSSKASHVRRMVSAIEKRLE